MLIFLVYLFIFWYNFCKVCECDDMKNKGQALVEFILVMPIFVFLLIGLLDIGNILYQKYTLETHLDEVTNYYREAKLDKINELAKNEDFSVSYRQVDDELEIILEKNCKVQTPLLNNVLGDTYLITTKRVIYEK